MGKVAQGQRGRECIGISNRSQLIYMANASLVVKSKMGHIHLHTHPLTVIACTRSCPKPCKYKSITRILKFAVESQQSRGRSKAISSDFRREGKWPSRILLPPVHTPLPTPENNTIDINSETQESQGKKLISTSHTLTYPSQQLEAVTIGGNVN